MEEEGTPLQIQISDNQNTDFKDALATAANINQSKLKGTIIILVKLLIILGPLAYYQYTDIKTYLTPPIQGCSLDDKTFTLDNCYNLSVPTCLNDTMSYPFLIENPTVLVYTVLPQVVYFVTVILFYEVLYIHLRNRRVHHITLLGTTGIFLTGRARLTTWLFFLYIGSIFVYAGGLVFALQTVYEGGSIFCDTQTVYLEFENLNSAAIFFKTVIVFALAFQSSLVTLWQMNGNLYDVTLQDLFYSTDNPECLAALTETKVVSTKDWDKQFTEYTEKTYGKVKVMGARSITENDLANVAQHIRDTRPELLRPLKKTSSICW